MGSITTTLTRPFGETWDSEFRTRTFDFSFEYQTKSVVHGSCPAESVQCVQVLGSNECHPFSGNTPKGLHVTSGKTSYILIPDLLFHLIEVNWCSTTRKRQAQDPGRQILRGVLCHIVHHMKPQKKTYINLILSYKTIPAFIWKNSSSSPANSGQETLSWVVREITSSVLCSVWYTKESYAIPFVPLRQSDSDTGVDQKTPSLRNKILK